MVRLEIKQVECQMSKYGMGAIERMRAEWHCTIEDVIEVAVRWLEMDWKEFGDDEKMREEVRRLLAKRV